MIDGSTLDTLVVDRREPSRNPDTIAAVRASRRRLMAGALPEHAFSDALLAQSGRTAIGHFAAIAAAVALIAALGVPVLDSMLPAAWGAITIVLCAALAMIAHGRAEGRSALGERSLQCVHVALAAAWAWFATMDCPGCLSDAAAVYRADALLVGMAVSALVHGSTRFAVPLAFTPAALVVATDIKGPADMVGLAMLAMVLGGLLLFTFVAARTRAGALSSLRLQFEKDGLIGDLETANAVSDNARQKAEEANMAKSRFLASMSHELRTPLNAIMGFSEVMKDEVLGPMGSDIYVEYAGDIHESGRLLLSLINEILDLSRIEAGRYELDLRPQDLTALARAAVSTLRVKAAEKDLTVEVRAAGRLPGVPADERAVRQVILNLLSNAIKFTPRGGRIDVLVGRTAGGGQYVTVADNGHGIPENELELVLSAFGQGSIALKAAEQGTGLGLAIVQALVQRHGGRFRLASELRRGTRATFTLPATHPEAKEAVVANIGGAASAGTPALAMPSPGMPAPPEPLVTAPAPAMTLPWATGPAGSIEEADPGADSGTDTDSDADGGGAPPAWDGAEFADDAGPFDEAAATAFLVSRAA